MSDIEPFARTMNFSNKEYRGRIIRVHALVLADKWVGTFIGDESESKSVIDEINEIVDARVKKAVEEFRKRAVALMREHPCTVSIYGDSSTARGAKSAADYLVALVEELPAALEDK